MPAEPAPADRTSAGPGRPERRGLLAAAVGSTVFFFVAPLMVAGVVPWWIGHVRASGPPVVVRLVGAVMVVAGFAGVIHCFARFVAARGTPAPVAPTERLVVDGLYRYVRNPMYVGVVTAATGQALWFGSVEVLAYAAAVWLTVAAFVRIYEEPTLRAHYGTQYDAYTRAVPAWIPRLTPWRADSADDRPRGTSTGGGRP
ncbi:MAG TPA: isoprenylcysteine carboxylmethyltransferase family protein [Dermatophilaceae bacterium]|jgi:protein-S-isoprenylcysteine O-methyltransferase Ste14|nr:isoprenylcysteine carboxylmethyltransferase family protein [Dermatophilaceae bacterium]